MEEDFKEGLRSLAQSEYKYDSEEFAFKSRELLLKAYVLLTSLEDEIKGKDALFEKLNEEKKNLSDKLDQAIESEKTVHERLAELDISRQIEAAEFSEKIESLSRGEGTADDRETDRLRREVEVKKLQLAESEENLGRLAEAIKNLEAENRALKSDRPPEAGERPGEAPASPMPLQSEKQVQEDVQKELDLLNGEINALRKAISLKDPELADLRDQAEALNKEKGIFLEKLSEAEALRAEQKSEYESRIEHLNNDINVLKTHLYNQGEALKAKSAEAEAMSAEIENRVRDFKEALQARSGELELMKQGHLEETEEITREAEKLRSERAGLIQRLSGMAEQIEKLTNERDELDEKLRIAGTAPSSGGEDAEALNAEIRELSERLAGIGASKAEEAAGYQERIENLEQEIGLLKSRNEESAEAAKAKSAEVEEMAAATETRIANFRQHLQEKTEELELLKQGHLDEMEAITSELERLRSEKAGLDQALSGMKDLGESERAEHLALIESLKQEIEDLGEKLMAAGQASVAPALDTGPLKDEIRELSSKLIEMARQIEKIRAEKYEKAASMTSGLEAVSRQISGMLSSLEKATSENLSLAEKLQQLSSNHTAYYPMVPEKKEKAARQRVGLKRVAAGVLVFVFAATAGAGVYLLREDLPLLRDFAAKPEVKAPARQQAPPWTGSREVVHEDFTATVVFLGPERMGDLGISSKVTEQEKAQNYFYVLEIKAGKDCIPEALLNAPLDMISFLDEGGTALRLNRLEGLDAAKKAIYKVKGCKGNTGAVFFRYFMPVEKTSRPAGIRIEGLTPGSPLIVR